MIDVQLMVGVLVALATLVGIATVLSIAMVAAGSVSRPGQAPHGGTRRDLPRQPQPDSDEDRVLVLR
jgi:hypothetical protein